MFEVERASGQSGIALIEPSGDLLPVGNCDDPSLSKKAIKATQLATAWVIYVPPGNRLTAAVKSFLESYFPDHVHQGDEVLTEHSRILREYLDSLCQRADYLHYSEQHLLERAKIQVEGVCSSVLRPIIRIRAS